MSDELNILNTYLQGLREMLKAGKKGYCHCRGIEPQRYSLETFDRMSIKDYKAIAEEAQKTHQAIYKEEARIKAEKKKRVRKTERKSKKPKDNFMLGYPLNATR